MRPSSGISKPASRRNSVVLPQPEGPSSAKNSPGKISSDRPATALTPEKRLLTASNRTSGAAAGAPGDVDARGTPRRSAAPLLVAASTLGKAAPPHPFHGKARPRRRLHSGPP